MSARISERDCGRPPGRGKFVAPAKFPARGILFVRILVRTFLHGMVLAAALPALAQVPAEPDARMTAPLGRATHPEGCGTSDYPFPQPSAALMSGLGASAGLAQRLQGTRVTAPAAAPTAPAETGAPACVPRQVVQGRNEENDGLLAGYDMRCTGKVDLEIDVPDDPKRPIVLRADLNLDGRPDLVVLDPSRQGHWSHSYWDVGYDGSWSLVGLHPDGRMEPTSFQSSRAPAAPR
jgi:hypothetical protein